LHVTIDSTTLVACNMQLERGMKASDVNTRVQKHRNNLRMAGLRPVQIWVPDTRRPEFDEECRKQSRLAAQSNLGDNELEQLMNKALADLDGWTD
jgi:hypothetical protein